MKFDVSFSRAIAKLPDCPHEGLPEIAMIGRSNVGKSSLINALANRHQLAKTSATPGKTQTLNFYRVNAEWYMVDMPGYGFARVSKDERAKFSKLIEAYLTSRQELRLVAVLVDSRHDLMASDRAVLEWLSAEEVPFMVVLTKADQSRQKEISALTQQIRREIRADFPTIATSSRDGKGIANLREFFRNTALERDS